MSLRRSANFSIRSVSLVGYCSLQFRADACSPWAALCARAKAIAGTGDFIVGARNGERYPAIEVTDTIGYCSKQEMEIRSRAIPMMWLGCNAGVRLDPLAARHGERLLGTATRIRCGLASR